GPNTVIVHGVAIDPAGFGRMAAAGAGLVWCPASNAFLFGRTAGIRPLAEADGGRDAIALGSDSRLTGAGDLLDELRAARATGCAAPAELVAMVTTNAARLLRLRYAGRFVVGGPADLIVVPRRGENAPESLLAARRRDVALVMVGGRPMIGEAAFAPVFTA